MLATIQGREQARVWAMLYDEFEYKVNIRFSRLANNSEPQKKVLTVIREEGYLDQFAEFVDHRLNQLIDKK